jgi:hypothetical protein
MNEGAETTEEKMRRQFLQKGADFFSWNSGKNTPNVLLQLVERIENLEASARQTTEAVAKLDASVREASASSSRLSTALNWLTFAYVAVAFCALIYQIWFSK